MRANIPILMPGNIELFAVAQRALVLRLIIGGHEVRDNKKNTLRHIRFFKRLFSLSWFFRCRGTLLLRRIRLNLWRRRIRFFLRNGATSGCPNHQQRRQTEEAKRTRTNFTHHWLSKPTAKLKLLKK